MGHQVVNGGQLLSATRFAELTGVSRERLRTWERRHGFPEPLRADGGPRRYTQDDVVRVVAVRCAMETGVPLRGAIARAAAGGDLRPPAAAGFEALVEHAPVPVAALSGPLPLRLEYANGALRALPGAPRPGEELTAAVPAFHGSPCEAALHRLFAADVGPAETEHPAWDGHPRHSARSALFRVPVEPGVRPLVAMVGLEGEGERQARQALAERTRELEELRRAEERHTRWLDAIALLATGFQRDPGPAVVGQGLDVVIRQTNAVDGALASYESGRIVLGGSRRGVLGPGEVTVAVHPGLAGALRHADPVWLEPAERAALRLPADLHASAVPVVVAGEPLGVIVLVFNEEEPHDADNRRLLASISAAMGFALLRDRLAAELRLAAGARAGA